MILYKQKELKEFGLIMKPLRASLYYQPKIEGKQSKELQRITNLLQVRLTLSVLGIFYYLNFKIINYFL